MKDYINTNADKAIYVSPLIQIIDMNRDIITESVIDPNQGEWDVE